MQVRVSACQQVWLGMGSIGHGGRGDNCGGCCWCCCCWGRQGRDVVVSAWGSDGKALGMDGPGIQGSAAREAEDGVGRTRGPARPDGVRRRRRVRREGLASRSWLRGQFFPEIEKVELSLDSIPVLRSLLCHFAVTPPRFHRRPRGSLDLVQERRSGVSEP